MHIYQDTAYQQGVNIILNGWWWWYSVYEISDVRFQINKRKQTTLNITERILIANPISILQK